ncbi:MAG: hypothetical protein ACRD2N_01635 [Vicinamibacterales bacterium]
MPAPRTVALVATCSIALVATAFVAVIRWWAVPISIGVLIWFAANGAWLARRLVGFGSQMHWLFGPVWGIGFCAAGMLILWLLGGRGPWIVALGPWPVWCLLLFPLQRIGGGLRLPAFDRNDWLAVWLLVLLVPLIVGAPYANVAEPVDNGGKAYRAYFTADFVWAMTVIAEVSKGDTPPKNPFVTGGALNYYWLAHFLSAAEYRMLRPLGLTIEEVTLANSIGYGVAFVVFLYAFVRVFGARAWPSAAAVTLLFLANSFEVLDRIVVWRNRGSIWHELKDINVDAVTRWFYVGMPVDGLQRMLLYQPHHLAGYALGLSALVLVARVGDASKTTVALAAGVFLGLSLLISSFEAIILGAAVAVVYAVRLVHARRWLTMPLCALLGALPVAAAVLASSALAYVDTSGGPLLRFGLNPTAIVSWPYLLLLSFGPLLLLGICGAITLIYLRRWDALPALALAAAALGFYFLTDVPDMQHVWVGWRAGHALFIALAVLVAVFFTRLAETSGIYTKAAWATTMLLALAAVPTVTVDIFNAQDINNSGRGASFPWTLRLSRLEIEALDWLKAHTPSDVIVQPDSLARASETWGYVTAFGERRMAAGLPIAMIPMRPYEEATQKVSDQIFSNGSVVERAKAARRLGIDYLFVGTTEQQTHPELVGLLETRSDLFAPVFRNNAIVVYWVTPDSR